MNIPIPDLIELRTQSKTLALRYDDLGLVELSHEFLRVFTPSAEARGHGPGQETLQTGKRHVAILNVQPVGQYALKFVFSDGHDTGLYTWELLYNLSLHRDQLWSDYLSLLEAKGASRDPAFHTPE